MAIHCLINLSPLYALSSRAPSVRGPKLPQSQFFSNMEFQRSRKHKHAAQFTAIQSSHSH